MREPTMLKKTLINNAIALSAYGVSIAAAWGSLHIYALDAFDRIIPQNANPFLVEGCIAAFLYVLCGFFLIPVKKRSYLSVASAAIAIIITLVICMSLGEGGLIYLVLNPIAGALFGFDFIQSLQPFVALLSPMFPSLFFYLGMVLRRLTVRRRSRS